MSINGRAAAPPGIGCIIGVSTSRKSRASKKRRSSPTIRERFSKTWRTSGLTIRST